MDDSITSSRGRSKSRSSTSSRSSSVSSAGSVAETRILNEGHCRAIYRGSNGQDFICDRPHPCRRKGHQVLCQDEETRGAPGVYEVVFSARGRALGLLAHTGSSLDDYSSRQNQIREQNQALAQALNLVQDGTSIPPSQEEHLPAVVEEQHATDNREDVREDQKTTNDLLVALTKSVTTLAEGIEKLHKEKAEPSYTSVTPSSPEPKPPSILRGSDRNTQTSPGTVSGGNNTVREVNEDLLTTFTHQASLQRRNEEVTRKNRDDFFHSLQVDATALGKDPSTGDKNRVFNIRLNDARGLRKGLSPSQLSREGASQFTEGLSDTTTYPRGEGTSDITEGSTMLDVLNTLVNSQRGASRVQVDTAFKSTKRNVLTGIKSYEKLQELLMTFSEDMDDLINSMMGRFIDILISNMGVNEEEARVLISVSPLYRIGVRTCELWIALLNTLVSTYHRGGWDLCARDLAYHATKLSKIRDMYSTRIQVLVGIYAYLRDGRTCSFRPQKLLAQQIDSLQSLHQKTTLAQPAETVTGETPKPRDNICKHCGTSLHSVNTRCPWKSKPSGEAKKEAAKALINMASPPTLAGADTSKEGA